MGSQDGGMGLGPFSHVDAGFRSIHNVHLGF